MKKLLVIFVTLALLSACSTVTFGIGARADGMGGAFVAVADDGFAPYYNPAGMPQLKALALTGDFIVGGSGSDMLYFDGFGGITTPSMAANMYFKDEIQFFESGESESTNKVDYIFSFATTLFTKSIAVGGNLKYAATIYQADIYDPYYGYYETYSLSGGAFTYDLGALVKPMNFISIGVVGRNMNEPVYFLNDEFGDETNLYDLRNSAVVAGIALKPSSSTTMAADLEMTRTDEGTPISIIHIGAEQTALWNSIAVRIGMIADPQYIADSQVITGGVGLKILGVYADMAIIGLTSDYPKIEFAGGFRW